MEYGFFAIGFVVKWLVLWRFVPLCGRGWPTGHPFPGRQSRAGFLGSPALFRRRFAGGPALGQPRVEADERLPGPPAGSGRMVPAKQRVCGSVIFAPLGLVGPL